MKTKFGSLGIKDVVKGIVMAFLMALVTGCYQLIQTGGEFSWVTMKPVLMNSIGAMLVYLIKNFFTNSDDKFLKPEAKQ